MREVDFGVMAPQIFVGQDVKDNANASIGWSFWRVAKYALIALGIILCFLVSAAGVGWWWMSGGVFTVDHFNAKEWSRPISNKEESTCYRGGMARDIEKRYLKPGMSKADVERLLGKPDSTPNLRELRYTLGMCSGFMMDYDDLHIYFNDGGIFERSAIIQH